MSSVLLDQASLPSIIRNSNNGNTNYTRWIRPFGLYTMSCLTPLLLCRGLGSMYWYLLIQCKFYKKQCFPLVIFRAPQSAWHGISNCCQKQTKMTTEQSSGVINDLIQINNDRIAGFEKAIADIKDENVDLKAIFQKYATQSRKNGQELAALVGTPSDVETGNSVSGTLHRAWIDVKSLFGGNDRAGILSEAERGEDAIKKAYKDALSGADLPANAVETVTKQAQEIQAAHDEVKALRDAAKA